MNTCIQMRYIKLRHKHKVSSNLHCAGVLHRMVEVYIRLSIKMHSYTFYSFEVYFFSWIVLRGYHFFTIFILTQLKETKEYIFDKYRLLNP